MSLARSTLLASPLVLGAALVFGGVGRPPSPGRTSTSPPGSLPAPSPVASLLVAEPPAPPPAASLPRREPVAPPTDPLDPLFLVNRRRAIPADFPVDARSPWTPCLGALPRSLAARAIDLLCLPRGYALATPEALRALAWDSAAPPIAQTHDGLPVGAAGRVGFRPMIDEARSMGHELRVRSGFRSYVSQGTIFRSWVRQQRMLGYPEDEAVRRAETSSAHAGHSEHQLGTTADLVYREPGRAFYEGWDAQRIADSPPMRWVHDNAHRFGLVVSYDRDATEITGYVWEPWHLRFVGVEVADELRRRGMPLEAWLRERYGEQGR